MKLKVAVQMDPIARINIRGDSTFALLLEAQKRGHALSYYTPEKLSLKGEQRVAMVQPLTVRDQDGDHIHARRSKPRRSRIHRRDPAAAGSTVRSRLHHHHAFPRTHPSEDAGREQSGQRAQRAGKDIRDGVRGPDAADADLARQGRDQRVPRRTGRRGDEAAVRPRRRGGVSHHGRTT